jgi:hypothetical protein
LSRALITAAARRRSCLVALLLVFAFALQQIGMTRVVDGCCDDGDGAVAHADDCSEADEPGGCAPSCTDCGGCPGPARVVMSSPALALGPASTHPLAVHPVALAIGRNPHLRLERPPRA